MKTDANNEVKALSKKVDQLYEEITASKKKLLILKNAELEILKKEEVPQLNRWFWIVIGILSAIAIATTVLIAFYPKLNLEIIWVCIFAGILGSSISAIISALQRKANGWQFKNGLKYPGDVPKDKFSIRMSTFFIFRPLLGVFTALIVYFGIESVFDVDPQGPIRSDATLIFWSMLTGLFAKSLIEKLKLLFDSVIK